jgi:hypothetical protein
MAAIKPDPSEMDANYQNGSGKFTPPPWHPSFALIAPCLKSILFCLSSVTRSRPWHMPQSSPIGHCAQLSAACQLSLAKGTLKRRDESRQGKNFDESINVAHVRYGAQQCRLQAVMHER